MKKRRLLVVEDEQIMRDVLEMLIARTDDLEIYRFASSREEALGEDVLAAVDLVVLDLTLPDSSGSSLLVEMRRKAPETPILVLSGHHEMARIQQARDAGAAGYILKGDPQVILRGIRRVLAGERIFGAASGIF